MLTLIPIMDCLPYYYLVVKIKGQTCPIDEEIQEKREIQVNRGIQARKHIETKRVISLKKKIGIKRDIHPI